MEIRKKSDITRVLEEGDKVCFWDIEHLVNTTHLMYILGCNNKIFTELGINKEQFSRATIWYYRGWDFPSCDNYSDLTKLVKALYDEWDKKFETKLSVGDIVRFKTEEEFKKEFGEWSWIKFGWSSSMNHLFWVHGTIIDILVNGEIRLERASRVYSCSRDMLVKVWDSQESPVIKSEESTPKKRRTVKQVESECKEYIKTKVGEYNSKLEEKNSEIQEYKEKVEALEESVIYQAEEREKLSWELELIKKLLTPIKKIKTTKSEWGDVIISDINKKKLHLSYDKNMPLLLEWPSGTGKSTIIRKLAELYKSQVVEFNINGDTNVEHLLGHKILVWWDMKFEDGALTDAVRHWKVFIAHEINACNPEVQFILNGLLERSTSWTLGKLSVQGNNWEVITPHPNFRFFWTYNRWYLGTKSFGTSIMSRFIGIRIDPLSTEQEEILLQKKYPKVQPHFIRLLVELENNLRNKGDFKYDISTRDIEQALIFIDWGFDMRDAVEATINQSLQIDLEKKLLEDELNSLLKKLWI